MSDDAVSLQAILSEFSPDEQRVIARAVQRIEAYALASVLKRLTILGAAVAAVLTLFGLASFSTIRSAVVETAAQRVADTANVRDEVVERATARLQRVNKVLDAASELEAELRVDRERALRTVAADLAEIRAMTQQIEGDIRSVPRRSDREASPDAKR